MRPAILAAMAVLASQAATAQVRHSTLPAALWGKWSQHPGRCSDSDGSVITLSAKTYATSKMNCTILWVSAVAGARGPIYSARMQCSNTADNADRTILNIILLPTDSNHILIGSGFGDLKGYERCSANEPVTPQQG